MGILALNNGEHIVGEINYDYQENNVQIRYDDKTLAFSAYQFYTFRLVKNDLFPERNFFVLPYQDPGLKRPTPHIFEGIYKGEVSLLVRSYEGMTHEQDWFKNKNGSRYLNEIRLVDPIDTRRYRKVEATFYDQYIAWEDGRVIKLKGGKKDRIKVFGSKKSKLTKYVKQNSLNLQKSGDMARLVQYFNDIQDTHYTNNSQ